MSERRKLKIVYLISELGKGGSERQLYLLLTHMDLTQVEPLVVVFNPSTLASYQPDIQAAGVRVIEIPPEKNTIIKRLVFLAGLLRRERPQVVHSWSVHNNPYANLAGWMARVPVRLGSLRCSLNNSNFTRLPRLFQKLAIHANHGLVVNAHSIYQELIESKVTTNKIIYLENCAALVSPPLGTPGEGFGLQAELSNQQVIATVCNFRENKNVHIFVQGLAQVMTEVDDLVGVVIGQPILDEQDYYQSIKVLISRLGVADQVHLLGFRDDAPALMYQMDIFCLLSDDEGTPNAILEAMAAGVPVIATQVGGIPDLVEHEVTGLLVPPQDIGAFISALRQLLGAPTQAANMGAAGQQAIKTRYNCSTRADTLLKIYRELLQEG